MFIFNPSHLITGQIFRSALTSNGYRIMQGHYGISKTFSIVLLAHLTEFIIDYQIMQIDSKNP